jgi:hypothetical protein
VAVPCYQISSCIYWCSALQIPLVLLRTSWWCASRQVHTYNPEICGCKVPLLAGSGAEAQACFTSTSVRTCRIESFSSGRSPSYIRYCPSPVVLSLGAQHEVTPEVAAAVVCTFRIKFLGICFACGKAFLAAETDISRCLLRVKLLSAPPCSEFGCQGGKVLSVRYSHGHALHSDDSGRGLPRSNLHHEMSAIGL